LIVQEKDEPGKSSSESDGDAKRDKNGQFGKGNTVGHRFQPGNPGKPVGAGKGPMLTTILRRMLQAERTNDKGEKIRVADAFIAAGILHARKGNAAFFKEIIDRIDGKQASVVEAVVTKNEFEQFTDEELEDIIGMSKNGEKVDDSDAAQPEEG